MKGWVAEGESLKAAEVMNEQWRAMNCRTSDQWVRDKNEAHARKGDELRDKWSQLNAENGALSGQDNEKLFQLAETLRRHGHGPLGAPV